MEAGEVGRYGDAGGCAGQALAEGLELAQQVVHVVRVLRLNLLHVPAHLR